MEFLSPDAHKLLLERNIKIMLNYHTESLSTYERFCPRYWHSSHQCPPLKRRCYNESSASDILAILAGVAPSEVSKVALVESRLLQA